jgi:hypothetical protein
MLARTQVLTVGSAKIRTLDPSDFMLHLCSHLYKEATTVPWIRMKRDMTFYKFCDIYGLLQDFTESDLDALISKSIDLSVQKEVLYCLGGIEAFFGPVHSKSYDELMKKEIGLDEVIAPTEKKTYRYTEKDIKKRFFAKDRMALLEEVTEV